MRNITAHCNGMATWKDPALPSQPKGQFNGTKMNDNVTMIVSPRDVAAMLREMAALGVDVHAVLVEELVGAMWLDKSDHARNDLYIVLDDAVREFARQRLRDAISKGAQL